MESNVPAAAEDGRNEATKVLVGRSPGRWAGGQVNSPAGTAHPVGWKEAWVCVSQVPGSTIESGKTVHQNPSILQHMDGPGGRHTE